jgi:DNA polymerase-3 subunit epsilon
LVKADKKYVPMKGRQVVLDTETTGFSNNDRIVEIGCVELIDGVATNNTF